MTTKDDQVLTVREQLHTLVALADAEAMTPTALDLSASNITYDQAEALARDLGALGRSAAWWTGDFLLFAEGRFKEKMAQLAHATGLSEGTLLNRLRVCTLIPPSRRRIDVSFSCHEEVANLAPNDQRKWLAAAAREDLTQRDLRQRIKDSAAAPSSDEAVGNGDATVGAGRVAVSDELTKAARNIWKHAQPTGDGFYLVPVEHIKRLGSLIGEDEA